MTERAKGTPADPADRPLVLVDVRPSACGSEALLWALQEAERPDAVLEVEQARAAMLERAAGETGVHGRTRVAAVAWPVTVSEVAANTGAELLMLPSDSVAS